MTSKLHPKIAVISMYEADKGLGLGNLTALAEAHGCLTRVYEPRLGDDLPGLDDFDVLLSSGGPGDPTMLETWGQAYGDLIEQIRRHNISHPDSPKRAFLICHSFQVMSHIWGIGEISRRPFALWGVQGQIPDAVPAAMPAVFPATAFYALESRFYQVRPTHDMVQKCTELGLVVAARDVLGALTAWQTLDGHIAATQFHPEGQAPQVQGLLDNRPVGDDYCVNMCPPEMHDQTRERLHLLPQMEQMLIDFITRV